MDRRDAQRSSAVTLVTGGVRGLGLACARRLARRGDRVHLVWRGSAELARAREAEFPGRVHRADLAREEDARALIEAVLARDGRLDHLVHAVGDFELASAAETSLALWRRMQASNVESALVTLQAALPALRAARGSAVLFGVAGLSAWRGRRGIAAYAAAKSALLVLARSLALEEGPRGVRVNVVSPGVVPHEHAHEDTHRAAERAAIPLGRPGRPEDVAEAVAWLCSSDAAYVTGQELAVAGGWMDA